MSKKKKNKQNKQINNQIKKNNNEIVQDNDSKKSTKESIKESVNSEKVNPVTNEISQDTSPIKEEIIVQENKSIIPTNNSKESNKIPTKKIFIISIIITLILLIVLFFSTIFALLNINKDTIINGVYIKGINVSNMTKDEANKTITTALNDKLAKELIFVHDDLEVNLFPEQFGVNYDIDSAINTAYSKGKDKNIFKSNYEILSSLILKNNIDFNFTFNEDNLSSLIKEMESKFEDKLIEPSYYIDGNNLIVTKGKNGIVVNNKDFKYAIISILNDINNNSNIINIPTEYKIADEVNLEQIHSEIFKEPKDAYFTTDPYAIYPHVDGIDFNITMEEAKNILANSENSFTIPLKIISPNITTSQINEKAFPDLLGNYSTTYSTANTNRSTNIRLASSKINGIIIMPGETFSYNKTVGKRTTSAGFKTAAVYSGGEVTTGIGGGICQVSSTLYNAVLYANLEIVERYNHGFNPGYVPAGRDATVSWGGPDFVFKNTRNYPVRIVCSGGGGTINCKIFGLKSDNEYDVEVQSYITQYIPFKTISQNDASLPAGTTKVIEKGSNGCRSVAYRILKQNGNIVSKTLLSNDTYSPHNRIVTVGTKQQPVETQAQSEPINTEPVSEQSTDNELNEE